MKTQRIRSQIALLLACASLTGTFAATTYSLTDLGTGWATDINTSGKVVGADPTLGGWYFDGTNRTTLSFPAYLSGTGPGSGPEFAINNTLPAAISDNGRIVGRCVIFGPPPPQNLYGFLYDLGGTGVLLGPTYNADPLGVNASGDVVGFPFLFHGTNQLGLAGFAPTGKSINEAGVIVGNLPPNDSGFPKAAIFTTATYSLLDLGGIEAIYGSRTVSDARSINNAGQIVGYVMDANSSPFLKGSTSFLYTNGTAVNLGGLGGLQSQANDINNSGLIVGSAMIADKTFHAYVYADGTLTDLNPLISAGGAGWVVTSANAVNDSGAIVGEGLKNGVQHSFLLTPVAGNLPPAVNAQPVGTNLFAGEAFTLAVTAAGSGPLTYQWQHAGTNVPAATNVTYTVAHATPDDGGVYQVLVTNAFGTTPSDSVTVQVKVLAGLQVGVYAGIRVTGPVGGTFRIEAVDQVGDTNWQALGNVTLSSGTFLWVDSDTLHPGRFYRAVPLP